MSTFYAPIGGTMNLSQFVLLQDRQNDAMRSFERGTTTPPYPVVGMLWHRTDLGGAGVPGLVWFNGTTWNRLAWLSAPCIVANGAEAYTASQPMGGFKHTGLGAGAANGESVRYEQVIRADGTNPLAGDWSAANFRITNVGTPTALGDAQPYANGNGLVRYEFNTPTEQAGAEDTSSLVLGWVPRYTRVRAYGAVKLQSDGTLIGLIDQEKEYYRWTGRVGPDTSFPGTEGAIPLWQGTIGSTPCTLIYEPRFEVTPLNKLGFWIRLLRDSDSAHLNIEHLDTLSYFGVGQ